MSVCNKIFVLKTLFHKHSHRTWYEPISPPSTLIKLDPRGFPGGVVVKNPPDNAGDMGLSPGPGRSHMPWSN